MATLRPIGDPLQGHNGVVWSIAFSPDGKTVVSGGGDRTDRLWDVATRRQLTDLSEGHDSAVTGVAFSPDGKTLAVEFGGKTLLSELAGRRLPRDRRSGKSPHRTLAADLESDSPDENSGVYQVTFSPDGKLLASTSRGYLRLIEVTGSQPFDADLAGADAVTSVAFSPNGKLIAGGIGNNVRIWDVDPNSWISRLCGIANRNLSIKEWQEYVGENVPYQRTCPDFPPGNGAK